MRDAPPAPTLRLGDAPPAVRPTIRTGTERMRRCRERRKRGMRMATLEVRQVELAELIRRGFLRPEDNGDGYQIGLAIGALLDRLWGPSGWPQAR